MRPGDQGLDAMSQHHQQQPGERHADDYQGKHHNAIEAAQAIGGREGDLGQPLVRHERLPGHSMGEQVRGGNGGGLEDKAAGGDMTAQVAVAADDNLTEPEHQEERTDKGYVGQRRDQRTCKTLCHVATSERGGMASADYASVSLYPTPRTVVIRRGRDGSTSTFSRRRRTHTSTRLVSPT